MESRHVTLAGHEVTLQSAGRNLADTLTRAFTDVRLEPAGRHGELTIKCWDTESTNVEPPPPPCEDLLRRGYYSVDVNRLRLTFSAVSGVLQAYLSEKQIAYAWFRSTSALPGWEVAAPLRTVISWCAESWGAVLAHAAVVGREDGGILLAGASGAGKSTTALACAAAGQAFLGDDCALVTIQGRPVAHTVYRTAKLDRAFLSSKLASLLSLETDLRHDRSKAILEFPRNRGVSLHRCPVVAVVTQGRTRSNATQLTTVSPARALASLAPSTLLQSPGTGQRSLDLLTELVRSVPCYELQAGAQLGDVAARLLAILR